MKKAFLIGFIVAIWVGIVVGVALAITRPPKPQPVQSEKIMSAKADPLEAMLQSAEIGAPWQYEGITIFPVKLRPVRSFDDVLTMENALANGILSINEIGSGDVNQVVAQNRSNRYIYLMAGQAIGGAKQDRIVSDDTLLAPHSRVEMGVWCVEQHRWTEGTVFKSGNFAASPAVRNRAAQTRSQSHVWAEVAKVQAANQAPAGSLGTVNRDINVQRRLQPAKQHYESLPQADKDTCGVMVANGSQWLAVDIFYEPTLFKRLWPELLDSYLVDARSKTILGWTPSRRDAEAFLGRLFWAGRSHADTPGVGRRLSLHGEGIDGSVLIMEQSVVHLEAFPGTQIQPVRRQAPSLEYRRGRIAGNR
jgi:hypothetical protein